MQELKSFGLSENECEVYLALLKIGSCTANRIATLTGMKRSTTYDNLTLLMAKGIVSQNIRGGVHYYQSENPEKLVHILEERRQQVERIVPQLLRLRGVAETQSGVRYFEGRKGAFSVLADIYTEKELLFYGSRKAAMIFLKHYPENFAHTRAKKGIILRAVLAEEDRGEPVYKLPEVKKYTHLRYLKLFDGMSANVFICSNRVSFLTSSEHLVGVIIKNKDIVLQQKKLFELLWNIAKK